MSLFGFPFLLTARQDPTKEGKYDFFIQVLLLASVRLSLLPQVVTLVSRPCAFYAVGLATELGKSFATFTLGMTLDDTQPNLK